MSPSSRAIRHITLTSLQPSPYHSGSYHHHILELFIVFAHTRVTSRIPLFYRAFTPLCRLTPPPFPRLARHRYASLASSLSPQPHSHDAPLSPHTLIATSLVHHLMH
ncbi:hypothetical protein P692DRAFT_20874350 [Suillus brevipes Sb2]|nr:hypothetical protein P692DRAFT_20874350 [Suillus brevipes Sb2]